jgi:hypothetical protein
VSRFPSFAFGENRLRSTALNKPPPLVPLTRCGIPRALLRLRRNRTPSIACASLDLPNRGRRVAYGSLEAQQAGQSIARLFERKTLKQPPCRDCP